MRVVAVGTASPLAEMFCRFRDSVLHRFVGGADKKALSIKDRKVELMAAGTITRATTVGSFKGRMYRTGQVAVGNEMPALLMAS